MKIADLYACVTQSIIADLERGVASWTKPWKNGLGGGGIMPVNYATGAYDVTFNHPTAGRRARTRPSAAIAPTPSSPDGGDIGEDKRFTYFRFIPRQAERQTMTMEQWFADLPVHPRAAQEAAR